MRHRYDQFEEIYKLIKNYDSDDAIIQTMKLKEISKCFTKNVTDEKVLSDLFDFLNTKALHDDSFVTKFISVVSSRQLEAFIINGKIVRHAMLEILQKNFQSADHFKRDDMNKFYNSLKLLGEYFNRARISNGSPINIIGQSLLNLLNMELEKELKNSIHFKTDEFSEIILTQFALNGNLLKTRHKTEIELVLMNVRKCLIEINSLSSKTKAFLIMTLDLYYANFNESNIESQLEKIYHPYLLDNSTETTTISHQSNSKTPSPPQPARHVEKERVARSQSNGRLHQSPAASHIRGAHERRSERTPTPKSPLKTNPSRPAQRRSEPVQPRPTTPSNHHYSRDKPASPQKKISPKELRTRHATKTTPPRQGKSVSTPSSPAPLSPRSPKSVRSVESAIDKLQIKSDTKQSSNPQQQQQQIQTPPSTPTKVQVTNNPTNNSDENILRQQNSNANSSSSSKTKGLNGGKVYFKEENVENLSWNGETSFESDPEQAGDASPKPNQYSSSFLNFLSNN